MSNETTASFTEGPSDDIDRLVTALRLMPHPEGGFYRETYRSAEAIDHPPTRFTGPRAHATAIYFLLTRDNFSALHRIKSDEIWCFHSGDALEVISLDEQTGDVSRVQLGANISRGETLQHVVPTGRWFGARIADGGRYALVTCIVAPGFDFADFEMAKRDDLVTRFAAHTELITALTRSSG